jgi:hypothetical protein
MGFKLGKEKGLHVSNGEIQNKMRFNKDAVSIPGVPVFRKDLGEGIMGEANMDGSVYLSNNIEPGSKEEREVLIHEMRHATDMKLGTLEYGDNHIQYNGEIFPRETIKGKDMILIYDEWKEAGDTGFPWEMDANNGNH